MSRAIYFILTRQSRVKDGIKGLSNAIGDITV